MPRFTRAIYGPPLSARKPVGRPLQDGQPVLVPQHLAAAVLALRLGRTGRQVVALEARAGQALVLPPPVSRQIPVFLPAPLVVPQARRPVRALGRGGLFFPTTTQV